MFDEAHHIQAGDDTGNQLGEVVKRIVDGEVESTRLLLATAFFFRGDKLSILEDRQLDRFFRHSIPFEDHWSSLQHLSCYRYDFVAYLGTVWQPLETLLATSQEATILYCPPEGHRLLLGKPRGISPDEYFGLSRSTMERICGFRDANRRARSS